MKRLGEVLDVYEGETWPLLRPVAATEGNAWIHLPCGQEFSGLPCDVEDARIQHVIGCPVCLDWKPSDWKW